MNNKTKYEVSELQQWTNTHQTTECGGHYLPEWYDDDNDSV